MSTTINESEYLISMISLCRDRREFVEADLFEKKLRESHTDICVGCPACWGPGIAEGEAWERGI